MWTYSKVISSLEAKRSLLINHSLYSKVNTLPNAKALMKSHVYAVWDFMSLLKSLQQKLTVIQLPWFPSENTQLAYFINQIVTGEESDTPLEDTSIAISHYDLYIKGMLELGAFPEPVESLVSDLKKNISYDLAFNKNKENYSEIIPSNTFDFIQNTIKVARFEPLHKVAASFLFGREDPIPDMFSKLLAHINEGQIKAPCFKAYLKRHIELDGEDHGPLSRNMIESICLDDSNKWREVYEAGNEAIDFRIKLWDGIEATLGKKVTLYELIGGKTGLDKILKSKNDEICEWGLENPDKSKNELKSLLCQALGGTRYNQKKIEEGKKIKKEQVAKWIIDEVNCQSYDKNYEFKKIVTFLESF